MTACVQAVAYLVVILVKGLSDSPVSKCGQRRRRLASTRLMIALAVHAYYALVAALGFLCPSAASAVTATHYNYGGAHIETGKKLKRYGLDALRSRSRARQSLRVEHSLGPFSPTARVQMHSARARQRKHHSSSNQEKRPLASMRVWNPLHGASSLETTPALQPIDNPRLSASERPQGTPDMEPHVRARATPASFFDDDEKPFVSTPDAMTPSHSDASSPKDLSEPPYDRHLPSPILSPRSSRRERSASRHSFVQGSARGESEEHPLRRRASRTSIDTVYSARTRRKIADKVEKGAWRRYGMVTANTVLFAAWLVVFRELLPQKKAEVSP